MELPDLNAIDFQKVDGLVPAIIQDAWTREVLMLGYMNREAIEKTIASQKVTFFSRTKGRLWTKGETSGNFLRLKSMLLDCDKDALLIEVFPVGPVCHTGSETCFDRPNKGNFIRKLEATIEQRKADPQPGSYTNKLFKKGVNKIAQKLGEEAVELIIEAKDGNDELFLNEAADLLYHYTVLLVNRGYKISDVEEILLERHQ